MIEKSYQLVVLRGPHSGQTYPLTQPAFSLGRDPAADIVFDDPEVSRLHARLVETEDGYRLEDLGSTNGTFVNGRNISAGPVLLEPAQEIQLGSSIVLLFELVEISTELPGEGTASPAAEEGAGETAVLPTSLPATTEPLAAAEPPPDDESVDPMLPPDFDDVADFEKLPTLRQLQDTFAENEPDLSDLPEMPELPDLSAEPPVQKAAPRVVSDDDAAMPPLPARPNSNRRLVGILTAVLLILLCCCCGFLIVMYQWGGDWLLRQMQLIP
ncbi:MAG: FHA domain-containing protein [Ardenticatenaceae bacterium]|nr:FHA domain-containing protein [Ardenticatenaceae bacterium]